MPGYSWNGSAWKKVLRKTMWTGTAWKDIKSSHRWTGSAWETIYSSFMPSGMTKNASAQNWSGSSAFQVTGMVAESGSTLSGSALLPNGAKTGATVTAQVSISNTNFMASITAELRKNGTLVPGGTVTASTSSTSTATLTIPTRTVDVVGTDQFTIWVTPGGASGGTVAAGVNTYVRIDRQSLGMTKAGSWVPTASGAWLTVPGWTADPGATVSGDGAKIRDAKANAVVSGQLSIANSTGVYQVSVRLKVDGVVVKTVTNYPVAGSATTNVPIASDPMAVTAGQAVTIECWFADYANYFMVQPGANTYVRST